MDHDFVARIRKAAEADSLGCRGHALGGELREPGTHAPDSNARANGRSKKRLPELGVFNLQFRKQRLPRSCDNLFMRPLLSLLARIHAAVSRGMSGSQKSHREASRKKSDALERFAFERDFLNRVRQHAARFSMRPS
jgi:hypothetical protein